MATWPFDVKRYQKYKLSRGRARAIASQLNRLITRIEEIDPNNGNQEGLPRISDILGKLESLADEIGFETIQYERLQEALYLLANPFEMREPPPDHDEVCARFRSNQKEATVLIRGVVNDLRDDLVERDARAGGLGKSS